MAAHALEGRGALAAEVRKVVIVRELHPRGDVLGGEDADARLPGGCVLPLLRFAVGVARRVDETREVALEPGVDALVGHHLHDVKVILPASLIRPQPLLNLALVENLTAVLDDEPSSLDGLGEEQAVAAVLGERGVRLG